MRINLNCRFHEKDAVKALGARWDAARKTWYIVDVEDLTPFMRWIPSCQPVVQAREQRPQKPLKDRHAPRTTGVFTALCNCDVPPWEDCEHTEALTSAVRRLQCWKGELGHDRLEEPCNPNPTKLRKK